MSGRLPVTVRHTSRGGRASGVEFRREYARRTAGTPPVPWALLLRALGGLAVLYVLLRSWRTTRSQPAPRADVCASPRPAVCAHGGVTTAGALANTAPAYRAALAHPDVTCVEVDVSRTREGALVALHSRQLLQLSGGEYDTVGDSKLELLQWYGVAHGEAQAVLTLHQALAALAGRGLRHIVLDLKEGTPAGADSDGWPGFVSDVLTAVREAACDECILWAKEDALVREVVRRGLGSRAGFVVMNHTADARARGMHRLGRVPGASVAAVHWTMADPRLVASSRMRVFGWTANEEHMADALVRAGVAAIVTDVVDMVAQRVAALRRACNDNA